jgi:hypothetical protein
MSLRQRQERIEVVPAEVVTPAVRAADLLKSLLRSYLFWLGIMLIILGWGLITGGTILATYILSIFSDLFTSGVIGIPLVILGLVFQLLGYSFVMASVIVELKRLRALRGEAASTDFV